MSTDTQFGDEIDLFDLIDDVKANITWLLLAVSICVLLALGYVFKVMPVFQTSITFDAANSLDLLELNQPRLSGVFGLNSGQAYSGLRKHARSLSSRRDFYQQLLDEADDDLLQFIYDVELTKEQNFSDFSQRFEFKEAEEGESDVYLNIQLELSSAQWATVLLNRYAQFVMVRYQQEVAQNIELLRKNKITALQLQADKLRQKYHSNKERRLLSLKEASTVAASINQARPFYSSNDVVVSSEPPMYMMGEKALRSEIAVLEARASDKNEDQYINGVGDLLWQIAELNAVEIDWQKVVLVRWDERAVLPPAPIKPKKALIVALAAVAGGMLGVVLALINAARLRRQQRKATV